MLDFASKLNFGYDSVDDAFPACDPGLAPFGDRVICQIRAPKEKTRGGLILPEETRETEHWNTQVAKVLSVGPLCFRNHNTLELWPEGAWFGPGDFVRVPRYGGDKWAVGAEDGREVMVVLFRARDIAGKVTGDPLAIKAFL